MSIRTRSIRYVVFGAFLMVATSALASCGGSKAKIAGTGATADSSPDSSDSGAGSDGSTGVNGSGGSDGSSFLAHGSDAAVTSAAGTAAVGSPLVLTGNGVDGSKFGDKFETVMTAMTTAHGAFDDDSLWEDQQAPCEGLGTKERRVQWGSVVLVFSNGPTEFGAAGIEHFISVYSEDAASPTPSNAPDGKALLDETVGNLKKRFPKVKVFNNEISGSSFQITTDGGGEIGGILSGLTDKDSVVSFNEGLICMD